MIWMLMIIYPLISFVYQLGKYFQDESKVFKRSTVRDSNLTRLEDLTPNYLLLTGFFSV